MGRPTKRAPELDPALKANRYVDLSTAAVYLDVSVAFLRGEISAGRLPARKLGHSTTRVRVADLDRLGEPMTKRPD